MQFAAQPLSALLVSHTEHSWDPDAFVLPMQVAFSPMLLVLQRDGGLLLMALYEHSSKSKFYKQLKNESYNGRYLAFLSRTAPCATNNVHRQPVMTGTLKCYMN